MYEILWQKDARFRHRGNQDSLPFFMICAGLPNFDNSDHLAASFMRREGSDGFHIRIIRVRWNLADPDIQTVSEDEYVHAVDAEPTVVDNGNDDTSGSDIGDESSSIGSSSPEDDAT